MGLSPTEYVLYLMNIGYTEENRAQRPMFPKEEKISDDPPRIRGYNGNQRDEFFAALLRQYHKVDSPETPTLTGVYFQLEKTDKPYYEWDSKFFGPFTQYI